MSGKTTEKGVIVFDKPEVRDLLVEKLIDHLGFNDEDGTYTYNLTRVKEAFAYNTMTSDDFEEIDRNFVDELAAVVIDTLKETVYGEIKRLVENNRDMKEAIEAAHFHMQNERYMTAEDELALVLSKV